MLWSPMRVWGAAMMDTPRLTLRVDLGSGRALGPGKIRLLEAIAKTGSISQAGRVLGICYPPAPVLVFATKPCFCDAVIAAQPGGVHGGGATLTPFGQKLVQRYRAIEADALVATRKHLHGLETALKSPKSQRAATSFKRSVRATSTRR